VAIKVLIINKHPDLDNPFDDLRTNGIIVQIIHSEIEHIEAIKTMNPDVIIIDSHKPAKNNGRLLPSIRAISKAPIMILSVVDKPGIVEKVLDRGADEYLLKPVSASLLTARIKALARRSYKPEDKGG
jgi:DNA-binding response OmpR family regulator